MPWRWDGNLSRVVWSVRYLGIAVVHGTFTDVQAQLDIDAPDPLDWRAGLVIQAASINSGYEAMDNHLRSADYLDVEQFPTIEFHSASVEALPGDGAKPYEKAPGAVTWDPHADHFRVNGSLTVRGVTKPAALDAWYFGQATDLRGNVRRAFRAETSIRRSDFSIYDAPQVDPARAVADQVVNINIDIVATQVVEERP